jgi:hypothetical protein
VWRPGRRPDTFTLTPMIQAAAARKRGGQGERPTMRLVAM